MSLFVYVLYVIVVAINACATYKSNLEDLNIQAKGYYLVMLRWLKVVKLSLFEYFL